MLVCPQCQFENPDDNKFCQRCGTSLTEFVCSGCEAQVQFDVENCPYCGTSTGIIWRAILPPHHSNPVDISTATVAALSAKESDAKSAVAHSATEAIAAPAQGTSPEMPSLSPDPTAPVMPDVIYYLDQQKRYKLLAPLPEGWPVLPALKQTLEFKVLDCKPLQPSPLETLQQLNQIDASELTEPRAAAESALSPQESTELALSPISHPSALIPPIAKTYLALQAELSSALPKLHDAWQQQDYNVLLLEDRSDLPLLLDIWGSDEVVTLQILHWLHEMIELWGQLHPQGCTQSLLELSNLKIDEDQLLCLQRLYQDHPDQTPTLRNLGHLWQQLFQRTQRTQLGSIGQLCVDLSTGAIADLDTLYSRFEAIAREIQPDPIAFQLDSPTPPTSPVPNPYLAAMSGGFSAPASEDTAPLPRSNPQADLSFSNSPTLMEAGDPDEDTTTELDDLPTVVLPMKLISIEDAGRSDVGRQRDHNEDFFSLQTELKRQDSPAGQTLQFKGLYILCDGMGGHAGGEVASALAVDTLKKYFQENWQDRLPDEASIRKAVYLANQAIYDTNQQSDRSGLSRMGTTLLLLLVRDTYAVIAHVGDSRLYRFSRRRGLEQLTVDHEVGQREIQRGVEPSIAYARPDAYQLTQALGPRDENFVNPDVQYLELNEDMLLLLCSDGLTDNDLLETHWRTHVEPLLSVQVNLEQGVSQLIELANQYNGHDNITAVVIRAKVRPNLDQLRRA
jgi:protein phosphatase